MAEEPKNPAPAPQPTPVTAPGNFAQRAVIWVIAFAIAAAVWYVVDTYLINVS